MPEILTRLLNIAGKPFGIVPIPRAFPAQEYDSLDRDEVFDRIHDQNYWSSDESVSGHGSELHYADAYLTRLTALLTERGLTRIFDAPCGDLNWVLPLTARGDINYVGADIAHGLVNNLQQRHPALDLRQFDICSDTFPEADVWHCRDCLFHLCFDDVRRALENFADSGIPYALLTTHKARWLTNLDVTTGGFRYLDLERSPIGLPRAEVYLRDYRYGIDFPRYVGLWGREDVGRALRQPT